MHIDTKIEKNNLRLKAIQSDIQKLYNQEKRVSCISDEELKKYVEKYFMLESIIDEHSANEDNTENRNKK